MTVIGPQDYTPTGYQGAAQHTYTPGCDGLHPPGPCPGVQPPGTRAVKIRCAVLTGTWQQIAPGLEARLISHGDQRVDKYGEPLDSYEPGQRFIQGALIDLRDTPEGTP